MEHSITVEGAAFRLRPVDLGDAEFMVTLRTDPELSRYLNPTSGDVEAQKQYIRDYFRKEDDYYFIVERRRTGRCEGMIAVYDVDHQAKTAEWGRWLLRKGSMAALESALLIYKFVFEVLRLDSVYCRTVTENEKVISFHMSCGLEMARIIKRYVRIGDVVYDSAEQRMTRKMWPQQRVALDRKAARLASTLDT